MQGLFDRFRVNSERAITNSSLDDDACDTRQCCATTTSRTAEGRENKRGSEAKVVDALQLGINKTQTSMTLGLGHVPDTRHPPRVSRVPPPAA